MIPSYKYDYDLSSKQKIFLYLYQVLPNIDVLKYVYNYKDESELEDTQLYHGMCPRNIQTVGSWIPKEINDGWKISNAKFKLKTSVRLMKYILEPGFICELIINRGEYTTHELDEIDHGNWISVVPNINMVPSLQSRIRVMNKIHDEIPLYFFFLENLERIFTQYQRTHGLNIYRLGINDDDLLIPRDV